MTRISLRRLKRLWFLCLTLTLYPLAGLMPRTPKRWVFGHHGGLFSGNPKYLYLWMAKHRPDIQITWVANNRRTLEHLRSHGFPVRSKRSLPGIVTTLRAGVLVYANTINDVDFHLSRGAFLLNLWHGVGVKALARRDQGTDMATEAEALAASFIGRIRVLPYTTPPDLLVTTSDFTQQHFANQFSLPLERCPQLGYPRLDCAFDHALDRTVRQLDHDAGFALNPGGYSEIYLYLPTFRDSGRTFFPEAIPVPEKLSRALEARNALLYIKPHPRTRDAIPERPNIRRWRDEIDFQPYLEDITSLITDYSSVLYDYLYIGRGAPILYTFDLDRYESERTLRYDFRNNTAGLHVTTFETLCNTIREGAATAPSVTTKTEIRCVRDRFWSGSSAPASPAIVNEVSRQLTSHR